MLRIATALGVLLLLGGGARAQALQPLENRDYTIDLYQGAALGSLRVVGMGGTAVATAEGSAGAIANPASPAVRPATSRDRWDWDWHADWLNPELGSDFDNNGIPTENGLGALLLTLGAVGQYGRWGVGVSVTASERTLATGGAGQIEYSANVARVQLARAFADRQWTVGVGIRAATLDLGLSAEDGAAPEPLFGITGAALETGVVWRQPRGDLRAGATVALPVTAREVTVENCDPLDCEGYILPNQVALPWEIAVGVAWRRAPTRWNTSVEGDWRDERALLVAADLVVSGAVDDGAGFEAFALRRLQPSGRHVVVSPRAGVEYEWVPGRVRIRGGSYWEPGRFESQGGRLHLTAGFDWRFWAFQVWSYRYRVRLSITADVASSYGNTGLSIGFWH